MWLAYAAFHLGDYRKALDAYQTLIDNGSPDQMLQVYQAAPTPHPTPHFYAARLIGRVAGGC